MGYFESDFITTLVLFNIFFNLQDDCKTLYKYMPSENRRTTTLHELYRTPSKCAVEIKVQTVQLISH